MKSNLWFKMMWNDTRLAWNPEDFGGLDAIRINAKNVRILELRQYKNDGIAERNLLILNLPRLNSEGKRAAISK